MFTLRDIPRFGGRPYLKRYGRGDQEKQTETDLGKGTWRFRLHHFVGPDDAGHHNHPFEWSCSFVLWRSYTEEVLILDGTRPVGDWCLDAERVEGGWVVTRRVRWFNWIPWKKYHQITELHGDVWTLFIAGPRVSSWGFWIPGRGHVDHITYKKERGEG